MRPRDTLDLGLILLWLLITTAAISAVDLLESALVAHRSVSLMPWGASEHGLPALDRDYLVIRNSVRRWLLLYLPLLGAAAGIGVGIACSSARRAWVLGALASLSVAVTGGALVLNDRLWALLVTAALTAVAGLAAAGSARVAARVRRGS